MCGSQKTPELVLAFHFSMASEDWTQVTTIAQYLIYQQSCLNVPILSFHFPHTGHTTLGQGWQILQGSTASQAKPVPIAANGGTEGGLSVWGPDWMCIVDTGTTKSGTLASEPEGNGRATCGCWQCVLKMATIDFPPWTFIPWRLLL